MIRIVVVDDDKIILDSIGNAISAVMKKHEAEFEILTFDNGKSLLKSYSERRFDILFLDIDMPDVTGIDIAKKLRSYNDTAEIIFVSNKDEMVYETIKYSPFRSIRKSRFESEINEAIENYLEKKSKQRHSIFFSTEDGKKAVVVNDIVYIEVKSHKLTVHTILCAIEANGNLKNIESEIAEYGFIRIHQSYLVNFRFIDVVRQKSVVLDNEETLPLGRGRYEDVKMSLMRFSREI